MGLTNWIIDPNNKPTSLQQKNIRIRSLKRRANALIISEACDRRGVPVAVGDILEERVERSRKGVWRRNYWVVTQLLNEPMEGGDIATKSLIWQFVGSENSPLRDVVVVLEKANNKNQVRRLSCGRDELHSFSIVDGPAVQSINDTIISNWYDRWPVHPQVLVELFGFEVRYQIGSYMEKLGHWGAAISNHPSRSVIIGEGIIRL